MAKAKSIDLTKLAKDIVVPESGGKKANIKSLESIPSQFAKRRKRMLRRIDSGMDDVGASLYMLRTMLRTLVDVYPTAERSYRKYKNERSAYAMVALIKLGQELANDIRALSDRNTLIDVILSETIDPLLTVIGKQVSMEARRIHKSMSPNLKSSQRQQLKEELQIQVNGIVALIDGTRSQIATKLNESLNR